MPTVYLLAGPNGTGKTTFYKTAVEGGFIPTELPFINVDLITQELGAYSVENYVKADAVYRKIVEEHFQKRNNFMIESNLAESRNYEWIALVNKRGYDVILYYLSTDDVEINIERVKRRVSEGGHDVPEAIIRSRYSQSHSYLKTKIREFKVAYLIDNSKDVFDKQAKVANGQIESKSADSANWINEVLSILERIQNYRK